MTDRIEYWLMVLIGIAVHVWYMHQRALRRAEQRGEAPPSPWDTARQLLIPCLAIVIGIAVAAVSLLLMLKRSSGGDFLMHLVVAFAIGCLVFGLSWLLLALLGARGPVTGMVLAAGAVGAVGALWFGLVLPSADLQRQEKEKRARQQTLPEAPARVVDHEHAREGLVPEHILAVSPNGERLQVRNRTGQVLSISVNKVLRRAGSSGYDRCLMAVEHLDASRSVAGSSLRATTLEFKPEVASGASALFAASCEERFRDAPLEFRVETAQGKTLFMSDSAFE